MVRAAARLALVHEALPVCVEALVEHVVGHIITQYERTASPAPSHPCSSPTLAHALVPTLCDAHQLQRPSLLAWRWCARVHAHATSCPLAAG